MDILKLLMLTGLCSVYGVHFEFGEETGEPCILLDIDAEFNLTYRDEGDNKTKIAPKFDLQGARVLNVSSICGDSEFDSVLTLSIFPTREELKFKFEPGKDNQISMSLTLSLKPAAHFSDMNDTLPFDMQNSVNLPAGTFSNDSYECLAEQTMPFDFNTPFKMTAKIKNLQVQAFMVENGSYGPANECNMDPTSGPHTETTELHTTEPHPITTVPSETTMTTQPHSETTMTTRPPITTQPATINDYVVREGKKVCIVLRGKMSIEIPYLTKDRKSAKVNVSIPRDTTVNGTCKYNDTDSAQEIMLSFYDGWDLTIIIVKDGKTRNIADDNDGNEFSWQKVSLTYVIDEQFPNALNPGVNNTVVQIDTFGEFKGNLDGSYKCNAKQSIQLQTKVKLEVSNLQYRAFGTSTDSGFSNDNISECSADKQDDNDSNDKTLAIILGAGFGGLAVLIIIAGIILRCKRQRYNSSYEEI